MIYSMTGYGKADKEIDGVKYEVEIKSLNSKYFDLQVRLPNGLRQKEMELRKRLENKLVRGKISFQISYDTATAQTARNLNGGLLKNYVARVEDIFNDVNRSEIIASLLRNPDVWIKEEDKDIDALFLQLLPAVDSAIEKTLDFRRQEGKVIETDLITRLNEIHGFLSEVEKSAPERAEKIRKRLTESLEAIKTQPDENRFEQELIYYLEKLDINEEISRLKNHLDYFEKTLNGGGLSKGKKLNFIAQEMGREINTIGSKANDASIQHLVVQMKDALEKIKEQTANIL